MSKRDKAIGQKEFLSSVESSLREALINGGPIQVCRVVAFECDRLSRYIDALPVERGWQPDLPGRLQQMAEDLETSGLTIPSSALTVLQDAAATITALERSLSQLHGAKFSDRAYHALKSRAEVAERERDAAVDLNAWYQKRCDWYNGEIDKLKAPRETSPPSDPPEAR